MVLTLRPLLHLKEKLFNFLFAREVLRYLAVHKEEEELKLAEIDCSLYSELCQAEGATVYPALLYYRDGQMLERYREPRTYGELREFVKGHRTFYIPSSKKTETRPNAY